MENEVACLSEMVLCLLGSSAVGSVNIFIVAYNVLFCSVLFCSVSLALVLRCRNLGNRKKK